MIFKQIDEILTGHKTQTRRGCKPNEESAIYFDYDGAYIEIVVTETLIPGTTGTSRRRKWQVGRTYAVVPGRGKPTVWWAETESGQRLWTNIPQVMTETGWQPLRIRITAIRREPLQSITEADARAEGVESVAEYRELWERINGKTKGADWESNPDVWVLSFELVKDGAP